MSRLIARRSTLLLAAAAALMVAAFASVPAAQASTLYACVSKSGGAHVYTKKPKKCKSKKEKLVSWNTVGPKGPNGSKRHQRHQRHERHKRRRGSAPEGRQLRRTDESAPARHDPVQRRWRDRADGMLEFHRQHPRRSKRPPRQAAGSRPELSCSTRKTNPSEVAQTEFVDDIALNSGFTRFTKLTTNLKGTLTNIAHVTGSASTPDQCRLLRHVHLGRARPDQPASPGARRSAFLSKILTGWRRRRCHPARVLPVASAGSPADAAPPRRSRRT